MTFNKYILVEGDTVVGVSEWEMQVGENQSQYKAEFSFPDETMDVKDEEGNRLPIPNVVLTVEGGLPDDLKTVNFEQTLITKALENTGFNLKFDSIK